MESGQSRELGISFGALPLFRRIVVRAIPSLPCGRGVMSAMAVRCFSVWLSTLRLMHLVPILWKCMFTAALVRFEWGVSPPLSRRARL
jgi:hypothetical protein